MGFIVNSGGTGSTASSARFKRTALYSPTFTGGGVGGAAEPFDWIAIGLKP